MDSSILKVLRSSSFSKLLELKTQLDDIIKDKTKDIFLVVREMGILLKSLGSS